MRGSTLRVPGHVEGGNLRIAVIDGHPDAGSYADAVARAYVEGAEAGGHEVRVFRLRDMQFDPILHGGFKTPQPLEPDLVKARDAIRWCQHFVIVTPCWWWHVPALLKGFIDRVFLPGVGVEYLKRFPYIRKLLKGRSARVIYTQNSPQWVACWRARTCAGGTCVERSSGIAGFIRSGARAWTR
jgi:putative NADPH-quinone reductase